MYYQNYEEYIRNILGYPTYMGNIGSRQYINTYDNNTYVYNNMPSYNQNLLQLYPETYQILKPMVSKICEENTKPITKELIEQMTEEIYSNFESDNLNSGANVTNIRVNVQKENRTESRTNPNRNDQQETNNKKEEHKQKRNPILQDFIKTLILDKLLYDNSKRRQYYQNNYFMQPMIASW